MRKALIIGIDNYAGHELTGCVADARAIAQVLQTNGNDERNFDVKLITGPVPGADGKIAPPPADQTVDELSPPGGVSRALLKKEIDALFADDSDIALFYFSGHGAMTNVGGVILTSDFQSYDEGVMMNEILAYANKSKAKDKIVMLDCCHSGAFGTPREDGTNVAELSEGMTVLTAARDIQVAMEKGGHGIFTSLVLDALNGGAADLRGHITPGSIYAYVDQALGSWDQRPIFKTNVTRTTVVRSLPPAIPILMFKKLTEYFPAADAEFKLDPYFEFSNPSADPAKVAMFKILQKFYGVDLIEPVGEEHMYYAAINSKSCRLTPAGRQYWRLVKEKRIP
ncbi:MAG: caspase family protein [Acidobacteria bacterium]|nr:caspase family protein [Acidobacteriota bacterium]